MTEDFTPSAGRRNPIFVIVDVIARHVGRLRSSDLTFRNDVVHGPGGAQILVDDRSGNPIELFQPTSR